MTLHILMLPGWLANRIDPDPTSGVFFREQADIMRRHGHRVNLFFPQVSSLIGIWKKRQTARRGLDIEKNGLEIWINYKPRWLAGRRAAAIAATKAIWKSYTDRHGVPDIVWVQSLIGNGIHAARYIRQAFGIPYFIVEHSARFFRPFSTAKKREIHRQLADALFVAAVGESLKKILSADRRDCLTLHNPVEPLPAVGITNTPPNAPFIFISVGRMEKDKGMETVIRAFARLINDGADCRLILVGDGGLLPELRCLAETTRLKKFISFTGFLNREKLSNTLPSANAYLSASAHETFNLSLVEGLACGLPAVATPTGIAPEILDSETGILAEGFDEESIYRGMKAILQRRYDRANIATRIRRQFSPEAYGERLTRLIEERL